MRFGVIVACLIIAAPAAYAGPWVPGRWHFYSQLRQSALIADRRYDADGQLRPLQLVLDSGEVAQTSYRQALTSLYVEVGLAARLSMLADFHVFDLVVQPIDGHPARRALGVSDLLLGAKLLLFDDELTASLQVAVTAPTGSSTAAIPLGPGDLRTDFMVLLGKLFDRPRLFLSGEFGVRLRGAADVVDPQHPQERTRFQYSHQLLYSATAGYTFFMERSWRYAIAFSMKLEGAYSFAATIEDGLGLLDAPSGSYVKLGPEIVWSLTRRVQLILGGHYFVAGRSTPAFGEAVLGVGYAR